MEEYVKPQEYIEIEEELEKADELEKNTYIEEFVDICINDKGMQEIKDLEPEYLVFSVMNILRKRIIERIELHYNPDQYESGNLKEYDEPIEYAKIEGVE